MSAIAKKYNKGDIIIKQGDPGEHMYVVKKGKVAIIREQDGKEVQLTVLQSGDFFW